LENIINEFLYHPDQSNHPSHMGFMAPHTKNIHAGKSDLNKLIAMCYVPMQEWDKVKYMTRNFLNFHYNLQTVQILSIFANSSVVFNLISILLPL
jgi:hypothetical protein